MRDITIKLIDELDNTVNSESLRVSKEDFEGAESEKTERKSGPKEQKKLDGKENFSEMDDLEDY